MKRILVIQTASIGDVILATAVIEKLHSHYPDAKIDYLIKKGNEGLFKEHPFLNNVLIWDKKTNKTKNLFKLLFCIRRFKYDLVVNIQRFFSSGMLTALSGAKTTVGFNKNPLSIFFTRRYPHCIGNKDSIYLHEVQRNQLLIASITDSEYSKPGLYPSSADYNSVEKYTKCRYICVAPASLWYTKQYPMEQWYKMLNATIPTDTAIYLIGGPSDTELCNQIIAHLPHHHSINFAGKLSLLQSSALMKTAVMNYVCDSSPMHLCSSVDAPVSAVFCSTIPEFGFGPLSSNSAIIQTSRNLPCRPCGLHGHKQCPNDTFECAYSIEFPKQ
ncbi:MAG: glycosyltransferase family 9 protein [Bacteroidales bacterium]|nr:glycosyltransferase family 9 protein [Bacteroidales bacterium]